MKNFENSINWKDCMVITVVFIIAMYLHNYSTTSWINQVVEELKNTNTTLVDIKELLKQPCEIEINP